MTGPRVSSGNILLSISTPFDRLNGCNWQAANVHHLKQSHVLHLYPDCWIKGKYQQHKKVRGVVEGRKRLVLMPEEDEAGDGESHEDDDKQGNEVE
jgi:hypothetical protein